MKKIKSVKRNGTPYNHAGYGDIWHSVNPLPGSGVKEWVHENVIRNCPLFEVEYEKERWRAEAGQKYYFVNSFFFLIDWEYERGRSTDSTRYDIGNYFKTKEQSQKFIESLKPIFEKFHREEGNYE
jgi:hypothetical protein